MTPWERAERHFRSAERLLSRLEPGRAPAPRRVRAALRELQRAVAVRPEEPRWQLRLAEVHLALGDAAAALEPARLATELEPGSARAWLCLGAAEHGCRRADVALAHVDRALSVEPDLPRAGCLRVLLMTELGRFEDAVTAWHEARLTHDPCDHCDLAVAPALLRLGDAARAVVLLRSLVARTGGAAGRCELAEALLAASAIVAAETELQALLTTRDDGRVRMLLARAAQAQGKHELSLEHLERGIELGLTGVEPMALAARNCLELDDVHRALTFAMDSAAADPTLAMPRMLVIECLIRLDQTANARSLLRTVVRLLDADSPDGKGMAMTLAGLARRARAPGIARAALERVARGENGPAGYWQNLAVARFRRRDLAGGMAAAFAALRIAPDSADGVANVALALLRGGEFGLAGAFARRAAELDPAWRSLRLRVTLAAWRERLRAWRERLRALWRRS
jgi:tetratricopeptide (TPR) repeat protein